MKAFIDTLDFSAPAKDRPQLWRTAAGFTFTAMIYAALSMALVPVFDIVFDVDPNTLLEGALPITGVYVFGGFIGVHFGLALTLRLFHKRTVRSLFGASSKLNLAHAIYGFVIFSAVLTISMLALIPEKIFMPESMLPEYNVRQVGPWLAWLPLAALLILIQSSAEELVFRGYLLQQLKARINSPWVYAVLPSLVFGLIHYDSESFGTLNASLYVLNTFIAGLIACDLTLRTGNLGAVIGVHFANNLLATGMSFSGYGSGFTLVTLSVSLSGGYVTYALLFQTGLEILAYLAWLQWMRRRGRR